MQKSSDADSNASDNEQISDESDYELGESDDEEYCYSIATPSEDREISGSSLKTTISKVRQLGKLFRKPRNKEFLQKYVREKLNTELELEIDCRTRWSSLFSMLAKFDRVTDCVEKAIVDANSPIVITANDKLVVKALVKVLEPAAATVKILSARDCNLLRARAAIKVMLLQLWRQENALAKRLALRIRERVSQRWEPSAGVLYYLHNASYVDKVPSIALFENEDPYEFHAVSFFENYDIMDDTAMTEKELLSIFAIPNKQRIKSFVLQMLGRHCGSEVASIDDQCQGRQLVQMPISMTLCSQKHSRSCF